MTLHAFLFWSIASLTAACALAVVVTQNIVRAATWLLFTLAGASGIFFLLGADIVGAIQLLIYVGGTLVLVVFGVMLTAQGPFISMKTGAAEWAVSGVVGLVLLAVLVVTVVSVGNNPRPPAKSIAAQYAPKQRLSDDPATSGYSAVIGRGFLGDGVGPAHDDGQKRVRMSYLLPFEIVSVHLLVVLIGAAYLARAKRRRVIAAAPVSENGGAP
jgi:NADH-quinone oxidoreductase subunit J